MGCGPGSREARTSRTRSLVHSRRDNTCLLWAWPLAEVQVLGPPFSCFSSENHKWVDRLSLGKCQRRPYTSSAQARFAFPILILPRETIDLTHDPRPRSGSTHTAADGPQLRPKWSSAPRAPPRIPGHSSPHLVCIAVLVIRPSSRGAVLPVVPKGSGAWTMIIIIIIWVRTHIFCSNSLGGVAKEAKSPLPAATSTSTLSRKYT